VQDETPQNVLETARAYVQALEQNEQETAEEKLSELASLQESKLFNELGKLTREFHDALNSFRHDERFAELAEDEIPDAKQRLHYVIERTDDAAHRTLNAVEQAIPLCISLKDKSDHLHKTWLKFTNRELTPKEFRTLSKELDTFLESAVSETSNLKGSMDEVLMAQDFQDITGQIIRRVIQLVEELEGGLVNLVKLGGGIVGGRKKKTDEDKKGELAGPVIPGMEDSNIVATQDDVDDLLSSLGF